MLAVGAAPAATPVRAAAAPHLVLASPAPERVVTVLASEQVGARTAANDVVALASPTTVSAPPCAAITSSPTLPFSLSGPLVPTIVALWPAQVSAAAHFSDLRTSLAVGDQLVGAGRRDPLAALAVDLTDERAELVAGTGGIGRGGVEIVFRGVEFL